LSTTEREQLSVQWQERMAGARTGTAGRQTQRSLARLVDHLLQPQLPWRMLLARYLTAIARDDYSYIAPVAARGRRDSPEPAQQPY